MKISKVEAIPLAIPYNHGGAAARLGEARAGEARAGWGDKMWKALDMVLVRVETDAGITGWGEAFVYNCRRPVQAAVEDMIAPIVLGREAGDVAGLMRELQMGLHLFGRYGITLFALSGLDLALWDIAGKAAGVPVCRLVGGAWRDRIPSYASLFRYNDPEVVAERAAAALAAGYAHIKLHEITLPEVEAARRTAGDEVPIMLDTNCPWTPVEAHEMARRLKPLDLYWLEEPIFPPEDFTALAELQRRSGIALAAGENACTGFQFRQMFAAGAVTFAQPSVTKVGGITEFLKVAALAETAGVAVMPHSPYFGPGWLATLQLMAALPDSGLIERFYVTPEASLYGDLINAVEGHCRVPEDPGLGPDPDPHVISTYRVRGD
ncbi:MAG: mandelate racemase/muconate lactonizing enzyme family protein [Kiloniellales bacterium]